jgi:hypothetical protein
VSVRVVVFGYCSVFFNFVGLYFLPLGYVSYSLLEEKQEEEEEEFSCFRPMSS